MSVTAPTGAPRRPREILVLAHTGRREAVVTCQALIQGLAAEGLNISMLPD